MQLLTIEKHGICLILLLLVSMSSRAQLPQDTNVRDTRTTYCVTGIRDYSFNELIDEGGNTLVRQLEVWPIPVEEFWFAIKCHIRRHHFTFNRAERRKAAFRAISFTYPSISPQGEPVMLSGLVTVPILTGNRPARMFIYHRLACATNSIAPSNSLPIESVLTADNTICVFPDYFGSGSTEGHPLPFVTLNYHARCATECVLAALDILQDNGIELDTGFYSWNSGYSQGGGYALATHKYIENALPDSLQRRINLRWSLCYGGVYSPGTLYATVVQNGDMGPTPAVFLQSLRGLLYAHQDQLEGHPLRDFMADKACESGIYDLLLSNDDGLWDLAYRLHGRGKSRNPADYFSPAARDTANHLYKILIAGFSLDDCVQGWHPKAPVVLGHSKKDHTIPFRLAQQTQNQLSIGNRNCILCSPQINTTHLITAVFYFGKLLQFREDELFDFFVPLQP